MFIQKNAPEDLKNFVSDFRDITIQIVVIAVVFLVLFIFIKKWIKRN